MADVRLVEEELIVSGSGDGESKLYVRCFVPAAGVTARASGAAALLLHGSESHAAWFDQVCESLAASGLSTFAFDRRGWGRSPGPRGVLEDVKYALAEVEAARRQVAREHTRVHLIGLSWGGLLAAAAREASPSVWASVTLVSPALFPRRSPRPKVVWSIVKALLARDTARLAPLPIAPEDFAFAPEIVERVRSDHRRTQAVSAGFWVATLTLLARVRRTFHRAPFPPTQILLAEHDPLIDTERTVELATARGARVTILPGTRHSLVLEEPAKVAELVLEAVAPQGGA